MHQSASFMVVSEKFVLQAPKAFQDYVQRYFRKETIFGQPCFITFRTTEFSEWQSGGTKGVAQSHSVDLMGFKAGLPDGTDLSEWIRKHSRKNGPIWEFHGSWEDGTSGPPIGISVTDVSRLLHG